MRCFFNRQHSAFHIASCQVAVHAGATTPQWLRKDNTCRTRFPSALKLPVFFLVSSHNEDNKAMANAQTCYFPDGSVADRDTPCNSNATNYGVSACCAHMDICLDNHLCLAQSGEEVITRGTCTDRTWQSSGCSQYCADGDRPLLQSHRVRQPTLA